MSGIIDIVFKQHYEKHVNAHLQKVSAQNRMLGRQQGWADAIEALKIMDAMGIDKNIENFVNILQESVLNNKHDASDENHKASNTEQNNKEKHTVSKPTLSIVP